MKNHTYSFNFLRQLLIVPALIVGICTTVFAAVNPPPVTPIVVARGALTFCAGDSVVLSVQTQPDVIGYAWSNGATTPTITVRSSGSYRVVVTTSDAITSDSSAAKVVVVNNLALSPTITAATATQFCEGDSVRLTASLPQPDTLATRLLGTEIGTSYLCNCPPGTVAVGYQANAGGVIDRFRFACKQLNANGTLGTTVQFSNTIGTSNGGSPTATVTAPVGEALTLVRIRRNGTSLNEVGGSTNSIANILNLTNASQTRMNGVISISAGGVADSVTIPVGHVIIGAEAFQNTLTYAAGFKLRTVPIANLLANFVWNNGVTGSSITVRNTGSYTAQVVSGSCTSTVSNAIAVTATAIPNLPTITGDSLLCTGDSSILTSSALTGNLWNTGDTTRTIVVRLAGNYSVRQINGICTSALSLPRAVNVVNTASAPTISGDTAFCDGTSGVVLTSSAPIGNVWNTGDTTQTITASTAGTYTVQVINGECSSAVANAIRVSVLPTPVIPTISGDTVFCSGGNVVLSSSALRGNLWSTGDTTQTITVTTAGTYTVRQFLGSCTSAVSSPKTVTVINISGAPTIFGDTNFCVGSGGVTLTSSELNNNVWSNGAIGQSIVVTLPGAYSVRTVSGNCSSLVSSIVNVRELALPTTPTISGDTNFCPGSSTILTSSALTGNLWNTGDTSRSITVSLAGSYSVRRVTGICTSLVSDTVVVTSISALVAPTISGDTNFCIGGSTVLTSSALSGNIWSSGDTSRSITVNAAGNYYVYLRVSGCTSDTSALITVVQNALPNAPVIDAPVSQTICAFDSVQLNATPQPDAASFRWSNGAVGSSIFVRNAGNYKAVAISRNGCVSDSSIAVSIAINNPGAAPTISIRRDTNFCIGDSVLLTVNIGAPTPTLSNRVGNVADTLYSCDCPPGYVAVGFEAASGGLIDRFRLSCKPLSRSGVLGATAVFATPNAGASTGGVTRAISSAADGAVLTSLKSRIQNINVLSLGGSGTPLTSLRANVTDGRLPLPAVEGVFGGGILDSAVAPLGHVIIGVEVSNNTNLYVGSYRLKTVPLSALVPNIIWSNGATTPTLAARSAGNYSVRTILNGCTTQPSRAVAVTTNTLPTISGNPNFCVGGSTVLTSSFPTGNIWNTGATSESIIVNTAGSYTVRNVQGRCTGSVLEPVVVAAIPLPVAPIFTATQLNFVEGDSSVLTIDSPVAGATYTWSNGAVGTRIVLFTADTISVTQTVLGCESAPSAALIITGIKGKNQVAFGMYPNPAHDRVTITANDLEQITLMNAQGKVVLTQYPTTDNILNLNYLAKGMYLVKVQTKQGLGTSKLLVK